jgi:hypothetical protein
MDDPRLNDFILVGGTALALTIGHRRSIDIDLFTPNSFDASNLAGILQRDYGAEKIATAGSSVFCFIDDIKTDLISHKYPAVEPHKTIEGIRFASLSDIAAMKLHAIVQSGYRKKDFVDVYFLLEKMPLIDMYHAYEKKYYPEASGAIARLALNDTSLVNENDQIELIKRKDEWPEMKARIKHSLEFTNKIYLPSPSYAVKKKQSQKRNKGRHL